MNYTKWRIRKEFTPRPSEAEGLSGLPAVLILLLVVPLVLAIGLVVALVVGLAALYRLIWRWLGGRTELEEPVPAALLVPERILDTPGLVLELLDPDYHPLPPALEALSEAWWEQVNDMHEGEGGYLNLLLSIPELPGLHGQLVTDFQYAWNGGLLLQLLQPATDAQPPTSFLVVVDPQGPGWEKVEEVGLFNLYRHPHFPAGYLEGWNRHLGQLKLHLEPGKPAAALL